jgi:hypothetical protein
LQEKKEEHVKTKDLLAHWKRNVDGIHNVIRDFPAHPTVFFIF